jgi:hypothetical protein
MMRAHPIPIKAALAAHLLGLMMGILTIISLVPAVARLLQALTCAADRS